MISRAVYPKQRGRRWLTALMLLSLVSGTQLISGSALAVHNDGLFELDTSTSQTVCNPVVQPCGDANVADSPAGGADDWANVYKSATGLGTAGPDHAFGRAFISDPVGSAENSFFTGGGSKDEREISSWLHANTNDVVPDKDDIAHAFAAAYVNPVDSHTQIYFGIDRYDNNGDAETGFWFFQNQVSLNPNGTFNGVHKVGDVLVLANWGGSNPVGEVTVYQWVGGRNPLALVFDSLTADCAKVGAADNVCAVVNRQTVSQPWPFLDKGGSTTIRPLELFEAGLDVSALFGGDRCFSSFLANTRSSHSTTAQLKDFALGGFEQCGAAISISPSAVNEVGESHTFTVHVSKTVGGAPQPAAGVFPTVTLTTANGAVVANKVDTCATTGTNASGDCTVTFTSNSAGTVTGNASASVVIGTDTFNVSTNGVSPNSGPAVKRFVDAWVQIDPDDVNEAGDSHTFTVTAKQNSGDGNGFVNVPNGTVVTVTLADSNGAVNSVSADTCATGTSSGTCSITFTSQTGGIVTGHAAIDLTLFGEAVHRETDATGNNSNDAVKKFVDAWITIAPDDVNETGDDHTFTVTVKQDSANGSGFVNVPDGTVVTVSLTDSNGATNTPSANTCATGTVGGECSITFTSPSGGIVTGHAAVDLTLQGLAVHRETDGTAPNSGDAVKKFVDAWITIGPDDVNETGDSHTFTVTAKQDSANGSGFVNVPDGTIIDVTLTDSNGAISNISANTCATGTVGGQCSITFTSDTGGIVTGHASIDLTLQGLAVHRETDGNGLNSGDAVKKFVDANITIDPDATNEVGASHTFTVTVQQDSGDGSGLVDVPDGTLVNVTLTDDLGAVSVVSLNSCALGGTVNGVCWVTFTSATGGTVTGHAAVDLTLGLAVQRETDGIAPNSDDAVKTFVDAFITIEPDATNETGDPHTFTVTAKQDSGDGQGLVNVPDGTLITVTLTDALGAAATAVVDGCALGTSGGQCTVMFTSATGGTVTGHASVDLTLAGLAVNRQTDGIAPNSDDAVKTFVDAYITINPPLATNTVGDPHTFTVNVFQDSGDGAGFVAPPDNTIVTVSLTPSAGATIGLIGDTCASPGTVGGECTVTFSSTTSGTVTGHASVDLTLAGLAVHRETDGIAPNSGDAVKHFVAGSIAWTKVDNAGALQGGATFEVCKTDNWTLPDGPFADLDPDECFDVADNGPVDEDPADGKFLISGLSLGRYTVRETIAPPGFVADPDTETVELTPGDTEQVIAEAFVNSREVLKITGFGYTNEPVGTPTSGVVNGIATFTVNLHNYGTADANLTNSSLVITGATCVGGNTLDLTGTIAAGADGGPYTLVCEYNGADGDVVQADLVVRSTTNGLEREASGSPARITFTIQAD